MAAQAPAAARGAGPDSQIDSSWVESSASVGRRRRRLRPPLDRARGLLMLGLLGAAAVVLWLCLLANAPQLPLDRRSGVAGAVELNPDAAPALRATVDHRLRTLGLADGQRINADPRLWFRSGRWIVDDGPRQQQRAQQALVDLALQQPQVTLQFEPELQLTLAPTPRGLGGLGAMCWLAGALALLLYLAAAVAVLAAPGLAPTLFGLIALAQSVNLVLLGAESLPGIGLSAGWFELDLGLRLLADATTGAALVHLTLVYPQRFAQARGLAIVVWLLALAALALALLHPPAALWWWAQAWLLGCGLTAAALLRWSQRSPQRPLAALMLRPVLAGVGGLLLLSLAMTAPGQDGPARDAVAALGSTAWTVGVALLLLLALLSRSRRLPRELALLVGVGGSASALELALIALFSLGPQAALLLTLMVSLAVYAMARPWMLGQLAGSGVLSAERMFDSLYRVARELEQAPEQVGQQLGGLLREVFDPLEVMHTARPMSRIRVAIDGSTMVVPVPVLPGAPAAAAGTIVLRFARRGRRRFTREDMLLTERLIEQLCRAAAYDRAVEHGRTEERTRIAQDLHDDIGARLLTLMYKAPNPEIEEYIRHTLQDLKTLTRGLAASSHRLSHAAAEWKSDITQRLNATGCDLQWSFSADRDITLSVVQWSGLTRVLRELVNNIITHAQATQVEIGAHLDLGQLVLTVSDDGIGRSPEAWSHGLGLGGVRKRVKLLGGQVQWVEQDGRGIRCEVRVTLVGDKR